MDQRTSDLEAGDVPNGRRRQLIRFDPTVSSGTILQMALLVFGAIAGYGTYQADKAKDHAEIAQIKVDAENQRAAVKESLGDLKSDVKDIQRSLVDVNQSLAVLKSRNDPRDPSAPRR